MNWLAYLALLWVFVGLEKGLRDALMLGTTGIAPTFVYVLVTLVAIYATPLVTTWAALIAGFTLDLVFEHQLKDGGPAVTIIGPYALAYLLSVQLILTLRGVMFRRNPLTVGFLSGVGGAVALCLAAGLLSHFGLKGRVLPIDARLPDAALLVNASPLGMKGQEPLDIDLSPLPDHALVYDLVYAPIETALLKAAKARDLETVDGLEMLVGQAAVAFELFFGVAPPHDGEDALRAKLLA